MADIIIIGNGAAGNSAAATIRRLEPELSITMVSREQLPAYSACALPDYLSGWVKREQVFIKGWQDYRDMRVEILGGRSQVQIDIDRRMVQTERERIPYGRLVLATGSRPFIPPVPGAQLRGNFSVKKIGDIDALIDHHCRQAVVVGSGNIGIELAQALHHRGSKVTLIEMQEQVLPRILDPEPAQRICKILNTGGIEVLTGEKVVGIDGREQVIKAVTDQRVIPCDTVIWASGMKHNIEEAQVAGIAIGGLGGIKVDEHLQTSCPGVYACGDCIEPLDMLTGQATVSMLWPNAKRQGEVAALNCVGRPHPYEGVLNMVTEEVCGVPLASLGLTTKALPQDQVHYIEGETLKRYWRIMVVQDRIMGMQSIGVTTGLGAVMAMIKNRLPLSEYKRILSDPGLTRQAVWLLPASQLLAPHHSLGERFFT